MSDKEHRIERWMDWLAETHGELAMDDDVDRRILAESLVKFCQPPPPPEPDKPIYQVVVVDITHRRFNVYADSEDEAQQAVEGSEDATADFGFKTVHSEWYVDEVIPPRGTGGTDGKAI